MLVVEVLTLLFDSAEDEAREPLNGLDVLRWFREAYPP